MWNGIKFEFVCHAIGALQNEWLSRWVVFSLSHKIAKKFGMTIYTKITVPFQTSHTSYAYWKGCCGLASFSPISLYSMNKGDQGIFIDACRNLGLANAFAEFYCYHRKKLQRLKRLKTGIKLFCMHFCMNDLFVAVFRIYIQSLLF